MDDDSSECCASEVADLPFTVSSAVFADNTGGVDSGSRDIRDEYQLQSQEADRVLRPPGIMDYTTQRL